MQLVFINKLHEKRKVSNHCSHSVSKLSIAAQVNSAMFFRRERLFVSLLSEMR